MNLDFLTTQQVAVKLHVSKKTLERKRTDGSGPTFTKVGGRVLYKLDDINNWLENKSYNSTAEYDI